ncbi:hypothetical protein ANCDUO_09746 [Ancylostoma duodenale]|uniref:Uncharacterized protein n=1 Tax=Ancylostoma duodenale TaxID=51022 RepID=A0A0C2GM23_9BILA|nr:hypothetical protein ANCDUO_09746 [Ancylostoma duodenale]
MAARTRREALRDLAENYVGTHQNEGPSRIASRFLGGSVKRRERQNPKPFLANTRGALSWLVDVHDHSTNQRVSCVLGLSQDALVLLERPSGVPIFCTPTHSIIGWANTDMGCEDPHCPAVKGVEQMLTPDAFARQPISYQEMFRMRNREYGTSPANSPAGSLEDRSFNFTVKRTDGMRANSTCAASGCPPSAALTAMNRQTSSVHDHMCLMLNAPKTLCRAQSDEHLRSPMTEENRKMDQNYGKKGRSRKKSSVYAGTAS